MPESTIMQKTTILSAVKNAGTASPDITTKRTVLKYSAFIAVRSAI